MAPLLLFLNCACENVADMLNIPTIFCVFLETQTYCRTAEFQLGHGHFSLICETLALDIFHVCVMGSEFFLILYFYFVPLVWYFDTSHTISNLAKNKMSHLCDMLTEWRGLWFLPATERWDCLMNALHMMYTYCMYYLILLHYPIFIILNFSPL